MKRTFSAEHRKGAKITEGKTKAIYAVEGNPHLCILSAKDDITKLDDPSLTQIMESKARHATNTTCNVFELLKAAGIPVAYITQISETEFVAPKCTMIPLEVIIRRFAMGSYLKRSPSFASDSKIPYRFDESLFELFLKTSGKIIKTMSGEVIGTTPDEDPFICNPYEANWTLTHSKIPVEQEDGNFKIENMDSALFLPEKVTVDHIENITRKTFLALELAWEILDCHLIDFKIEFGITDNGELLVADVIDNDSWRLRDQNWEELSKQNFRDNVSMDIVGEKYEIVSLLSDKFENISGYL